MNFMELFFILERLYRLYKVSIRYVDDKGTVALFSRGYSLKSDPVFCDKGLLLILMKAADMGLIPKLYFETEEIVYGILRDEMGCYIIVGPVCLTDVSNINLKEYMEFHNIAEYDFRIKQRSVDSLCSCLSLAFLAATQKMATETEIVAELTNGDTKLSVEKLENEIQRYSLANSELGLTHFSYQEELSHLRPIAEGKPELIATKLNENWEEQVGILADKPYKQFEYMTVATITLSARTAMSGGLDAATAYAVGEIYLQRLSKCQSINEVLHLVHEVMVGFAEKVKLAKEKRGKMSLVEQSKLYIARNLNKPIGLPEIAEKIGVNRSYLSRKFSESEGQGIQGYIRQKRLEVAANMLKFSDETISNIAFYTKARKEMHFSRRLLVAHTRKH
jgi:AraC-like DNA-binding protein